MTEETAAQLLTGLDHSVIRVPDLEVGLEWYRRVLGLVEVERRADRVYLASPVTGRTVLGLAAGGTGLEYVSYRAVNRTAFEYITARLDEVGVKYSPSIGDTRTGATDALRVTIPTGHSLEIILAEDQGADQPIAGEYRAGALDVRPSHVQLRTTDVRGLSEFLEILGFKVSTYVPLPDSDGFFIQFLRVNDRHHQLAILTGEPGIHHVALELNEVEFWRFLDHLAIEKAPAEYGPGKHHEGKMLFLYVRDPFKNRLEITGPMESVGLDDPPQLATQEPWFHMNMWGPQAPESWQTEWM
ncbi:VOC family protein [Cryptosporangium phraense]|uniref:Bleomycin resistance protein n=1 Tax=Cryptosporangium phraense TaxID=2593070 RepID=A0A545AV34_9ACTN|nr:VOC family protein [Cryptosporangium phraense]TQS45173.1 bleomycin resistance protein [Cryptosporangium phraense]